MPSLDAIKENPVTLPKSFRNIAEHLVGGGSVTMFLEYLEVLDEKMTIISTTHFTHFDIVIEVNGNIARMTVPPENLIFGEGQECFES